MWINGPFWRLAIGVFRAQRNPANQSEVSSYPMLNTWLANHRARRMWRTTVRNTQQAVEGWMIGYRFIILVIYRDQLGWTPGLLPVATREWARLVSLPLFPDITDEERDYVITVVSNLCRAGP